MLDLKHLLGLKQLHDLTRSYARDFVAGTLPADDYDIGYGVDTRWHRRIHRDANVDIWLISWLPQQYTELHDHGGSSGSFTVLTGTLTETVVGGGRLTDLSRAAGESIAFGPHYVHDVRNTSDTAAVSVHAYSPPLTTMTYYNLVAGTLTPTMSLATDDPEPVINPEVARAS